MAWEVRKLTTHLNFWTILMYLVNRYFCAPLHPFQLSNLLSKCSFIEGPLSGFAPPQTPASPANTLDPSLAHQTPSELFTPFNPASVPSGRRILFTGQNNRENR